MIHLTPIRRRGSERIFASISVTFLLLSALLPSSALAQDFVPPTHTFKDLAVFQEATGAQDLTGPLPEVSGLVSQQTVGQVTFETDSPSALEFGPWFVPEGDLVQTSDPFRLLVDGQDVFSVVFASPVASFGLELRAVGPDQPRLDGEAADSAYNITLCRVVFSTGDGCPAAEVIDKVLIRVQRFNNRAPDQFAGFWSDEQIAQVLIEDLSEPTDGNELFGRVYGGGEPRPFPAFDRFENDDLPLTASFLAEDIVLLGENFATLQTHSLHRSNDEDWIFYGATPKTVELTVSSDQPEFHAVVDFFPGERAGDASVPSLMTLGDCAGLPGTLTLSGQYPSGGTLVRVRNCGVEEPVRYDFLLEVIEFDRILGGAVGIGTVTEEGTGDPVSVALLNDDGRLSFSSPSSGGFRFLFLPGVETTLTVVSPLFEALPVVVEAVGEFESPPPVEVVVRPKAQILFASGFEQL